MWVNQYLVSLGIICLVIKPAAPKEAPPKNESEMLSFSPRTTLDKAVVKANSLPSVIIWLTDATAFTAALLPANALLA